MIADPDDADAAIADALAGPGWTTVPGYLDPATVRALREAAAARRAAGEFRGARVGRGGAQVADPALRGDLIRWLDAGDPDAAVAAALARLDALRVRLNRALWLGLDGVEAHFAAYPPGARYGVHVDRFRDDDARVVSVVVYLNDAWTVADGGLLRLHLPPGGERRFADVLPAGGTLAVFLSDRFPHEVLPARRERWSLTGWMRRRGGPPAALAHDAA